MLCLSVFCLPADAQVQTQPPDTSASISTDSTHETDAAIRIRLERIYAQIAPLSGVRAQVADGVVTLRGTTREGADSERAEAIAHRVEGVVAVQNSIEASLDVTERVKPFFQRLTDMATKARDAAPLFLLAILAFALIAVLGWWSAAATSFWRRFSPNPFIGDLLAQAVRVLAIVVGIVVALNLIGATALMGTVLGGAGVIGLAIGFAVRDALENYISSIMLSLRQPFRANDQVVIDGHEGKVVRLTSRATILMTLDGNHLRIPNATVFKAVILNYTRNPERRLSFELGVDANDDPQAAIEVVTASLAALGFILKEPPPAGVIQTVGDSNIVLNFTAWINQQNADFLKARSTAIRAAKMAVEAAGFTLPEPIYRLRIDQMPPGVQIAAGETGEGRVQKPSLQTSARSDTAPSSASVAPDDHLNEKIDEDRQKNQSEDLLSKKRPIE